MVQIGSLEDKYEKLNERVTNIEEQPKTIENISDIVREEVRKMRGIEMRRLHMVVSTCQRVIVQTLIRESWMMKQV